MRYKKEALIELIDTRIKKLEISPEKVAEQAKNHQEALLAFKKQRIAAITQHIAMLKTWKATSIKDYPAPPFTLYPPQPLSTGYNSIEIQELKKFREQLKLCADDIITVNNNQNGSSYILSVLFSA